MLKQGIKNEIVVEADAEIIQRVETFINGNILIIDIHPKRPFVKVHHLKIWITVQNIEEITLNGSGDLTTLAPLKSGQLKLKINGSGDARIEMENGSLDASINGSGNVSMEGVRGTLILAINGSGDFLGKNIQIENADITVLGSGDVKLEGKAASLKINSNASGDINTQLMPAEHMIINVKGSGDIMAWVTSSVKVFLYGSGDVIIYGKPKDRQVSKVGSGNIRFI